MARSLLSGWTWCSGAAADAVRVAKMIGARGARRVTGCLDAVAPGPGHPGGPFVCDCLIAGSGGASRRQLRKTGAPALLSNWRTRAASME